MPVINKTERIRALNDALRRAPTSGTWLFTSGVAALSAELQRAVVQQLAAFDSFDAGNDPHGEHDFGAFTVGGHRLFFKFDSYDQSIRYHSPDPADPALTRRVLTVMLAEEY